MVPLRWPPSLECMINPGNRATSVCPVRMATPLASHWALSYCVVLTALTICSCRDDIQGSAVTPGRLHPKEANIPVVEDDRFILRIGSSTRPFLEFVRPPLHSIGIHEGPQHAMIGTIADTELRRRSLYYADG